MLSKQEHTNSLPKSSHLPDCHANVCLYIIGCEYTYACCVYMLCIYDYMYVYTVLYVKRRYIGTIGRLFKRLPHKSLIQLLCKCFQMITTQIPYSTLMQMFQMITTQIPYSTLMQMFSNDNRTNPLFNSYANVFKRLPHKSLIQLLCKMFYNHR